MDKQRNAIFKRPLALFLVFALMLGTLSDMTAYAEGGDSGLILDEDDMITAFDALPQAVASQIVTMGTPQDALALPDTLDAEVNGVAVTVHTQSDAEADSMAVTVPVAAWQSSPEYDGDAEGLYIFTPELSGEYTVAEGVAFPTISVTVKAEKYPPSAPEEESGKPDRLVTIAAFAAASITGVTAPGDGRLPASGGNCVITITGTDLDSENITVTAFVYDVNAGALTTTVQDSKTATATSATEATATLTFPANTLASTYLQYTVMVSLDGGGSWDSNTATVIVRNAPFTITSITPAQPVMTSAGGSNTITLTGVGLDAYNGPSYVLGAFLGAEANPSFAVQITGNSTSATATLTFPANNSGSNQVYTIKYSGNYGTSSTTWETTSCTVTVPANVTKTVSVGAQQGTLTAGIAGTVTFPVSTTGIANGSYTVNVVNRPTGVTVQGQVTISNNTGTLTLAGNTTASAGIYNNLGLTIDGVSGATFTLTIVDPTVKTVSVGAQQDTLRAGVNETVRFPVTTTLIADGSYPVTVNNLPAGVTVQGNVTISNNAGTLTLAGDATTTAAITNTLTLTIDGATSVAFTLTIIDPSVTGVISVSPTALDFGTVYTGYAQRDRQMVTVENTGTVSVTLTQPTSTNYDAGALSKETLDPGKTASLWLRPHTGLAAGSYNETITISGSGGTTASVNLRFTVINNSSGSGSGGGTYAVTTVTEYTVTKAEAEKLVKEAQDKGHIKISFSGQIFITKEAWEVFAEAGITTEGGRDVSTLADALADALAAWNANPCQENGDALLYALFTPEGLALAQDNPELAEALKFFGGAQTYAEAKQIWDNLANESYAWYASGIAGMQANYGLGGDETYYDSTYLKAAAEGDYEGGALSVLFVASLRFTFSYLNKDATAVTTAGLIKMAEEGFAQAKSKANAPINALAAALGKILNPPRIAVVEVNTTGSPVQVRVTVYQPGKMKTGMYVSGAVKGSTVNSVKSAFNKYFTNDVRVISLDYKGEWGQVVRVAAKVDLTAWEGDQPVYFYAYEKEANTYRRIKNPAPRLDENGYLHFNTRYGGEIIVSEGELEKKAGESGTALQDVTALK